VPAAGRAEVIARNAMQVNRLIQALEVVIIFIVCI